MVVWVIILSVLLLFLLWVLISPFIIEIDTRFPRAGLRWVSIGNVWIWFEDEWWLGFRILFFHKQMRLSDIKSRKKKKEKAKKKRPGQKKDRLKILKKMVRVIRTFRVKKWEAAIDTGDYTLNAKLYPLNFLPVAFNHLKINYEDRNYLILKIQNRPWRIIKAFLL